MNSQTKPYRIYQLYKGYPKIPIYRYNGADVQFNSFTLICLGDLKRESNKIRWLPKLAHFGKGYGMVLVMLLSLTEANFFYGNDNRTSKDQDRIYLEMHYWLNI